MMFLQWPIFLGCGRVAELETEPVRIAFHLVGELVTAVLLIVAGVGGLQLKPWGALTNAAGAGPVALHGNRQSGVLRAEGPTGVRRNVRCRVCADSGCDSSVVSAFAP
jgi:hypothetical protein